MAKKELVDYFKKGILSGMGIDELTNNLLKEGWPHELVNEAKFEIRNHSSFVTARPNPHVKQSEKIKNSKKDTVLKKKNFLIGINYFVSIVIVLLGVFSLFIKTKFVPPFSLNEISLIYSLFIFLFFIAISLMFVGLGLGIKKNKKWAKTVELVIFIPLFLISFVRLIFDLIYLVVPAIFVIIMFLISGIIFFEFIFDKKFLSAYFH